MKMKKFTNDPHDPLANGNTLTDESHPGTRTDMKPKYLDTTYRTVFFASKLCGVLPFILEDGWLLRLSKPALLYTFVLVSFLFFSFSITSTYHNNDIFTYIIMTEKLALNVSVFLGVLWLLLRHERLSDALSRALFVERRHGVTLRCTRYLVELGICSSGLILGFTYRVATIPEVNLGRVLHMFSYYFPSLMMINIVMQFASINLLIGDCFVVASAALVNSSGQAELANLLRTHFSLLRAAESINSCYGLQNLCVITASFVNFTSSIYFMIHEHSSFFTVATSFVLYPLLCWNIVYVCNETKRKAKRFTETLYQLALDGKSIALSHNGNMMKVCYHFGYTKEIEFSACGLFVLDLHLICSLPAVYRTHRLGTPITRKCWELAFTLSGFVLRWVGNDGSRDASETRRIHAAKTKTVGPLFKRIKL